MHSTNFGEFCKWGCCTHLDHEWEAPYPHAEVSHALQPTLLAHKLQIVLQLQLLPSLVLVDQLGEVTVHLVDGNLWRG